MRVLIINKAQHFPMKSSKSDVPFHILFPRKQTIIEMYYFYVKRKKTLKKLVLFFAALIVAQVVVLNLDSILYRLPLQAFTQRMSNRQLTISEDGRWTMWATVIKDIPIHPFGNITSVRAAHNIYLDVARESGVIPMVLLFIFTAMVLTTAWKLLWNNQYSIQIRIFNAVLIFSLWASFLIEPVMTAKPFVFIAFCMVCGMQKELNRRN